MNPFTARFGHLSTSYIKETTTNCCLKAKTFRAVTWTIPMGGVSGNNDESLIGGGGQRLVLYLGIHFTLD